MKKFALAALLATVAMTSTAQAYDSFAKDEAFNCAAYLVSANALYWSAKRDDIIISIMKEFDLSHVRVASRANSKIYEHDSNRVVWATEVNVCQSRFKNLAKEQEERARQEEEAMSYANVTPDNPDNPEDPSSPVNLTAYCLGIYKLDETPEGQARYGKALTDHTYSEEMITEEIEEAKTIKAQSEQEWQAQVERCLKYY